jgi:UDP-glucose 4-epimerase
LESQTVNINNLIFHYSAKVYFKKMASPLTEEQKSRIIECVQSNEMVRNKWKNLAVVLKEFFPTLREFCRAEGAFKDAIIAGLSPDEQNLYYSKVDKKYVGWTMDWTK